jgi:hypothetical protein
MVAADDTEKVFIGLASASDAREGYPWAWVVSYGGERRSGACITLEQARRRRSPYSSC